MGSRALRFLVGIVVGVLVTSWLIVSTRPVTVSEAERDMALRMHAFVRALYETPQNANPAQRWKPLVEGTPLLCATCHGAAGERYERLIEADALTGEAAPMDREAMSELMEEWVEWLNRDAEHLLRKAVVCTDCHDRDPRRN